MNGYVRTAPATGPRVDTSWSQLEVCDAAGRRRKLWVAADTTLQLPNERSTDALFHTVFDAPRLPRDRSGAPLFSMTVTVSRPPTLDDTNIARLADHGQCGFEIETLPPDELLHGLSGNGRRYLRLFVVRTEFEITAEADNRRLAHQIVEGPGARAAFTMSLDRQLTTEVLKAVHGHTCAINLHARLTYRTQGTATPIRATVDLSRAYQFLVSVMAVNRMVYERELANYLPGMLDDRIIRLADELPVDTDVKETLLKEFVRAARIMFRRVPENSSPDLGECFYIGNGPPDGTIIEITSHVVAPVVFQHVKLSANLSDIIGEALSGCELESHLHFVTPSSVGGSAPVPRRLPRTRSSSSIASNESRLAVTSDGATSLSLALRPSPWIRPALHAMLPHKIDTPLPHRPQSWRIDDLRIGRLNWLLSAQQSPRALPVVAQSSDIVWCDRIDPAQRWYAPEFRPIPPSAAIALADSPFVFRFITEGHDQDGRPGLKSTIHVTLEIVKPDAVSAELEVLGQPVARPVEPLGMSVALELPFRDEHATLRRHAVTAIEVKRQNDRIIATFSLADRWARICYGSLAVPGFQPEPARVVVSYSFEAYVPVNQLSIRQWHGSKSVMTPVVAETAEVREDEQTTRVNRRTRTLHTPSGDYTYRNVVLSRRPSALHNMMLSPSLLSHAIASAPVVHPHLQPHLGLVNVIQQQRYGLQSFGRSTSANVVYPCHEYGSYYVQLEGTEEKAIGCRDAYQLGQTEFKLYDEIRNPVPEPRPGYRVFRSLQTPERFLVVPDRYLITRFEPGTGDKAYRPAIYLYSLLDATDLSHSQCVLAASLQPDVPAYRRLELLEALRRNFHSSPIIEYPTELACDVAYDWSIADGALGGLRAEAAKLSDSFQVSFTCEASAVPQLQAMLTHGGLSGRATFLLPDNTRFESVLQLDLSEITGPWNQGPVDATIAGAEVVLTNRIERSVDVSDLYVVANGNHQKTRIDRRLGRDEQWRGPLADAPTHIVPVAIPDRVEATLPEIRSFIEDIRTNIVFINQISFASHALRDVQIVARIKGVPGESSISLSEETPVGSLDFLLPLTTYLARPTLQYQAVLTGTDGQIKRSAWQDWNLTQQGNVIGLIWDNVQ